LTKGVYGGSRAARTISYGLNPSGSSAGMGLARWIVTELDSAETGDVNALSNNKIASANAPLDHLRNDFMRHFPFVFINVVPARYNKSFYLKDLLYFNAFGGSFGSKSTNRP
jgi:hypothetical protein